MGSLSPPPASPGRRATAGAGAAALAVLAALAAACGVSNNDICGAGIAKRQACDPNLAATMPADAVGRCEALLDKQSNTCHNGAALLVDCVKDTACGDIAGTCQSPNQIVQLNCSQDPFSP